MAIITHFIFVLIYTRIWIDYFDNIIMFMYDQQHTKCIYI